MRIDKPKNLRELAQYNKEQAKKKQKEESKKLKTKEKTGINLVPKDIVYMTAAHIKESLPKFKDLEDLKGFIKQLDIETLEYLIKCLNIPYAKTNSKKMHRTLLSVAIQNFFFPKPPVERKPKKNTAVPLSAQYTTDELFRMLREHNQCVSRSGNDGIDRMRAVKKLKFIGLLGTPQENNRTS